MTESSSWQAFRRDAPGTRFIRRYERMRARQHHPAWRVLRAAGGMALILIGVVFMVLPGPGIVPVIAGLALMASDSPRISGWLDRAELKVRSWRRR